MKRIIGLIFLILQGMISSSQSILIQTDAIIVKRAGADTVYNLIYSVSSATTAGSDISVTVVDGAKGTAQDGRHYIRQGAQRANLTPSHIRHILPIRLLPTSICDNKDKTIKLHLKAVPSSGDTAYHKDFELTIKYHDTLKKDLRDSCKQVAKNRGQTWHFRERLPDPTNTAKLEFVTYTDLKGFDPDAPNGLVQNQFLFKWPIIKKWVNYRERNMKVQVLRSFIFPNILLNRIDKTKETVLYQPRVESFIAATGETNYRLKEKTINSFDVIKYSNIVLNGKLSLINFQFPKSRFMLQYNLSTYLLRIDTAKLQTQFDPLYALSHGPHIFFETGDPGRPEAFQLRLILGYENLRLRSNIFHQVDGYSTTIATDSAGLAKLATFYGDIKQSSKIWQMSARLSRSISKDNKANIFFRFNVFWQHIPQYPGSNPKIHSYNTFSQYQLGADLNIGSFGGG